MKKLLLTKDVNELTQVITALGYDVISTKKSYLGKMTVVEYKEGISPSKKVIELRNRYMVKSMLPFFVIVTSIILAFLLASAFLILNLVLKDQFDVLKYFFIMMLPAFVLLLIGTLLTFYRYQITMKNLNSYAALAYIRSEVKR